MFALINGKYIKHVGDAISNDNALWGYNGKSLFVPPRGLAGKTPHLPSSG